MFKVIENNIEVDGNEEVIFTLYHNGVAVATTDHYDAVDTMLSDYCYDNDIACDPHVYMGA